MSVILTTYQGAILGPIAKLLGTILEGIYRLLSMVGIENTGICLILFTFIVNALMIPLQVKQQKFAKMSAVMNPELQAIQKKYKNKKDQESQQKMSMETQEVYKKYGVSPAAGCLPLLITLPILFALYRVIYNVPAYVGQVYDIYAGLAEQLKNAGASVKELSKLLSSNTYVVTDAVKNATGKHAGDINYYVDILGQYGSDAWDKLASKDKYSSLASEIAKVKEQSTHINYFLGLNIANTPAWNSVSVIIPILSVITQWISTKVSMAGNPQTIDPENSTAASMKMMNNVMPFITGAMCFMFPIGVGIYWVTGNVFRILQSIGINLYFDKVVDMDELMKKNIEKNKARMEKMGVTVNNSQSKSSKENSNSFQNGKNNGQKKRISASEAARSVKKVDNNIPNKGNKKYKEGSIAAYANMLRRDDPEN